MNEDERDHDLLDYMWESIAESRSTVSRWDRWPKMRSSVGWRLSPTVDRILDDDLPSGASSQVWLRLTPMEQRQLTLMRAADGVDAGVADGLG